MPPKKEKKSVKKSVRKSVRKEEKIEDPYSVKGIPITIKHLYSYTKKSGKKMYRVEGVDGEGKKEEKSFPRKQLHFFIKNMDSKLHQRKPNLQPKELRNL